MPLIHIYLEEGKSDEYLHTIGNILHEVLMQTWKIPEHDRFQIFHEHKRKHFDIDKEMWDIKRSNDVILFQIISSPRTSDMKATFYQALPMALNNNLNIRTEDVFISLVTNTREDWTFGNGKMQLLE